MATQLARTAGDQALDPHRLIVSAHEIGHAIAWSVAGMPIVAIWVEGRGPGAHGYVKLDGKKLRNANETRDYLIGLLAGRAAGIRWCESHGLTHHDYTCADDLTKFRQGRQHRWVRHIPDSEFHTAARLLVRQHWPRIARLAPELSRRGSVDI